MKAIFILLVLGLLLTGCGTYVQPEVIKNEPLVIEVEVGETVNNTYNNTNNTLLNSSNYNSSGSGD